MNITFDYSGTTNGIYEILKKIFKNDTSLLDQIFRNDTVARIYHSSNNESMKGSKTFFKSWTYSEVSGLIKLLIQLFNSLGMIMNEYPCYCLGEKLIQLSEQLHFLQATPKTFEQLVICYIIFLEEIQSFIMFLRNNPEAADDLRIPLNEINHLFPCYKQEIQSFGNDFKDLVFAPETEEELISFLKENYDKKFRVDYSFCNKTFEEIVNGGQSIVDKIILLDKLNLNYETLDVRDSVIIDKIKKKVRVPANIPLYIISKIVAEQNLSLKNVGNWDQPCIGSLINMGIHGSNFNDADSFSDQVTCITGYDMNGQKVSITDRLPYFNAAICSMGTIMIITEVELQLVDLKTIKSSYVEISDPKYFTDHILRKHPLSTLYYFPVVKRFVANVNEITNSKTIWNAHKTINDKIKNFMLQFMILLSNTSLDTARKITENHIDGLIKKNSTMLILQQALTSNYAWGSYLPQLIDNTEYCIEYFMNDFENKMNKLVSTLDKLFEKHHKTCDESSLSRYVTPEPTTNTEYIINIDPKTSSDDNLFLKTINSHSLKNTIKSDYCSDEEILITYAIFRFQQASTALLIPHTIGKSIYVEIIFSNKKVTSANSKNILFDYESSFLFINTLPQWEKDTVTNKGILKLLYPNKNVESFIEVRRIFDPRNQLINYEIMETYDCFR